MLWVTVLAAAPGIAVDASGNTYVSTLTKGPAANPVRKH